LLLCPLPFARWRLPGRLPAWLGFAGEVSLELPGEAEGGPKANMGWTCGADGKGGGEAWEIRASDEQGRGREREREGEGEGEGEKGRERGREREGGREGGRESQPSACIPTTIPAAP
jgi:hypothetical protein